MKGKIYMCFKFFSFVLAFTVLAAMLLSCGSTSEAIMTFKDSVITANMYSYWLSTYKSDFLNYYNNSMNDDSFWESEVSAGVTAENYAMNLINQNIQFILIGMQLFKNYGLKISTETSTAINEDIKEKIDFYGSRANLNTALSAYGINVDILKDIYIAEEKLYAVYDYLYGENGTEKVTEDMLDEYYKNNYSRVKYIIIYTKEKNMYDENGNLQYDSEGLVVKELLSEEELDEKNDKIKEAMICVNAGDEFESIMESYNEEDMSNYKNGFYMSANELNLYGFAMINNVKNMKTGEIRLVEDNLATYIIKKYDLIERDVFLESDIMQLENMEKYCIQEIYESKFSQYIAEIIINKKILTGFSIRTAAPNSTF